MRIILFLNSIRILKSTCFLLSFIAIFTISDCFGAGGGGGKITTPHNPIVLAAPVNINASDGTYNDRVAISWTAVTGAISYKIYRGGSATGSYSYAGTATLANYNDNSATFQTTYYYKIAAIATDNTEGDTSNYDSGYSDNIPGSITGLNASNGTYTDKVSITWTSDGNSAAYEVSRSTTSGGTYTLLGEPNQNSYDDSTATPGITYYYKVKGKSSLGTYGIASGYDSGYIILAAPGSVSATMGTQMTQVNLSWGSVSNAVSYKIYRSASTGGTYSQIGLISVTSYSDNSSTVVDNPGISYFYKVAGVSSESLDGLQCGNTEGYVGINKPSNVQASDARYYNSVKITWTGVTGASSYRVFRAVNAGAYDPTPIGTPATANYSDSAVSLGNTYSYKISAMSQHESAMSDPDDGTVKNSGTNATFSISWLANREKGVNRSGGGYRVYYNQTTGFDIGTASFKDVPYVSGPSSPITTTLDFTSGQLGVWYIKIVGYSNIGGSPTLGLPSDQISLTVE